MNWYVEVLKKYATFAGRASRNEYWLFVLFHALVYFALAIVDGVIGTFSAPSGIGVLTGLYFVATLVPSLAVQVRRLHDTDRSGWWIFIVLVPIVGAIVLLVFLVRDSQPGTNEYGPNPKATDEAAGQAPHQAGTAPAGQGHSDSIAQLERLAQLKDKGVLTEREFQAQKAKILSARNSW